MTNAFTVFHVRLQPSVPSTPRIVRSECAERFPKLINIEQTRHDACLYSRTYSGLQLGNMTNEGLGFRAIQEGITVRRILKQLIFLAAIALLASTALYADTIKLVSLGTTTDAGQTNSSGNPTIAIDPNTAWSSALGTSSWVSFANSGNTSASDYHQVANGTVTSFFDHFTLSGTPTSGWIEVMADDSTSVLLNGHLLIAEAPTTNNTYRTCSDFDISCRGAYLINLNTNYLVAGDNVLDFSVGQRAGSSYGLDYYGEINQTFSQTTAVPEPSSLLLFGTGVSGLLLRLRRRRS